MFTSGSCCFLLSTVPIELNHSRSPPTEGASPVTSASCPSTRISIISCLSSFCCFTAVSPCCLGFIQLPVTLVPLLKMILNPARMMYASEKLVRYFQSSHICYLFCFIQFVQFSQFFGKFSSSEPLRVDGLKRASIPLQTAISVVSTC